MHKKAAKRRKQGPNRKESSVQQAPSQQPNPERLWGLCAEQGGHGHGISLHTTSAAPGTPAPPCSRGEFGPMLSLFTTAGFL